MTDSTSNIIKAFKAIDFVNRFESITTHLDFNNRMTRIDKKEILYRLSKLGYEFKVITPGRDFYFDSKTDNWRFRFSFNLNGGVILPYIYVYDKHDNKIHYENSNLIYTYKYLIDDLDKIMNPSTVFCNYEEFDEIISGFLKLYEDFKVEYLMIS